MELSWPIRSLLSCTTVVRASMSQTGHSQINARGCSGWHGQPTGNYILRLDKTAFGGERLRRASRARRGQGVVNVVERGCELWGFLQIEGCGNGREKVDCRGTARASEMEPKILLAREKSDMLKGLILGILLGILLVAGGVYYYFSSGHAPVDTSAPPIPFEKKLASVGLHAYLDKLPHPAPQVAADEANVMAGAKIYKEQCATCHGLPN